MPSKLTNSKETAEALGITTRQLRNYIAKGCPAKKARKKKGQGGKAPWMFELEKVRTWMVANGIESKPSKSEPAKPFKSENPTGGLKAEIKAAEKQINQTGMAGALERLRKLEMVAYKEFVDAYQNNSSTHEIAAKEKIYVTAHDALRKSEKEIQSILEQRGQSLPVEVVLQEQAKIDMAIKREFLTLPTKVAQQVSQMNRAEDVQKYLTQIVDDILRHISKGEIGA